MMQNNAIAMLKLADHDEIVPDYATFLTDSFARYGAYTSKVRWKNNLTDENSFLIETVKFTKKG